MENSALFAIIVSAGTALLTVAVGGLVWSRKYASFAVMVLAISLVAGQLIRLPLPGQGGGILVSDIAALAVIAGAIIFTLKRKNISPAAIATIALGAIFLCWAPIMMFVSVETLPTQQVFIGLAYWARLVTLLALIPALCILCEDGTIKKSLYASSVVAGAALLILGFIQYIFVPNLSSLVSAGWDPHIGRLVSTWLDPNFFGIFCVLYMLLLVPARKTHPQGWLAVTIFALLALIATQSRSSWLAAGSIIFITPFLAISLRHSLKPTTLRAGSMAGGALALASVGIAVIFLRDRLAGLLTGDATTQLRADSLQLGWSLIVQPHWLLGVGYNAFGWYAQKAGLISDFLIHSRSGLDNSFLALWATTGLIGLLLFSSMWSVVVARLISQWRHRFSLFPLIAIAAIGVLVTHSLFINSFLYAHTLIFLAIIIALAWSESRVETV